MTKPQSQQQHPTRPIPDPVEPSLDDDATIPDLTQPGQKPPPNRKRRRSDPPAPANDPARDGPR
jgi:hypothetical protein